MKPSLKHSATKSLLLLTILLLGWVTQARGEQSVELLKTPSEIWLREGVLTENGQQLVQLLKDTSPLGLPQSAFQPLARRTGTDLIDAKQLSNDALESHFEALASALSQGASQADEVTEWHIPQDSFTVDTLLDRLRSGDKLSTVISSISPASSEYSKLISAFQHYQSIETNGGWPTLAESDRILKPGTRHIDIEVLRNRLRVEGDFAGGMQADPLYYGPQLVKAVRQYQTRHGLFADGILDRETRNALRVPVRERLQQVQVNLERWRWLPRTLEKRRLWVNTAGAFAQLVDNSEVQLQLRAIAGRPYRATPSLFSSIESLVVNPAWGVPHQIAVQDLLPLQKKNKHFFAQKNIRVFKNSSGRTIELDRNSIDWLTVSANNFPYQLRQDPGELNSMGRIKFIFANEFNVYLHDTPNKVLFELPTRNFSSGCVRLEKPFELANAVLADNPQKLKKLRQLSRPENAHSQTLNLEQPLPIYLVYMTAWHDEQGLLHFTADSYGRDREIAIRLPIERSPELATSI